MDRIKTAIALLALLTPLPGAARASVRLAVIPLAAANPPAARAARSTSAELTRELTASDLADLPQLNPQQRHCLSDAPCAARLAQKLNLDFLLAGWVRRSGRRYQGQLSLVSIADGAVYAPTLVQASSYRALGRRVAQAAVALIARAKGAVAPADETPAADEQAADRQVAEEQAEAARATEPAPQPAQADEAPRASGWVPEFPPLVIEAESEKAEQEPESAPTAELVDQMPSTWIFRATMASTLFIGLLLSWLVDRRNRERGLAAVQQARVEGLSVPASLHARVDVSRCVGCGTCASVCHGDVYRVVENQSQPIFSANCVGCGACRDNCPVEAIELVFGTAERGVELPKVGEAGESDVPGLYISGELSGIGLIANAFERSVEIVDGVAAELQQQAASDDPGVVDLLVVGAGPAGLGAALRAQELGLSYACVERESWGGAIRNYPRGKIVMTRPIRVPLYGPVKLKETTKEALVELWEKIIHTTGVVVQANTDVQSIERSAGDFRVSTNRGEIRARRVLLAIGRAGTPRKMGIPGEESANVAYRMLEPENWAGKQIAVVGGGDVACEVALALCEQPDTHVSLVYRGEQLTRPKPKNRQRVQEAAQAGKLTVVLQAKPSRVDDGAFVIDVAGTPRTLPIDQIFVCAGGVPPTNFLEQIGVEMVTKHGEA